LCFKLISDSRINTHSPKAKTAQPGTKHSGVKYLLNTGRSEQNLQTCGRRRGPKKIPRKSIPLTGSVQKKMEGQLIQVTGTLIDPNNAASLEDLFQARE